MKAKFTIRYQITEDARKQRLKDTGESGKSLLLTIAHGDPSFARAVDMLGLPGSSTPTAEVRYREFAEWDVPAEQLLDAVRDERAEVQRRLDRIAADVDTVAAVYCERNGFWHGALSDYFGTTSYDPVISDVNDRLKNDRGLSDLVKQIEARLLQRKKQEQEEKRAAEARRAKEKAERIRQQQEVRNQWIAEHGSTRLQRMAAEEIECERVYLDERLALERPGWQWYQQADGDYDDPRNPPEEAFAMLDQARQVEPTAKLVYWRVDHDCDDDCEGSGYCPKYDWTGYAAVAEPEWHPDREIVFGLPAEITAE